MLQIEFLRFGVGRANHHKLRKPGAIGIVIQAGLFDLGPVAIHHALPGLVAAEAQIAVRVIVVGGELPGFHRSAAGQPHRRMRLLKRLRPGIDVAQLGEFAVERKRSRLGPRLHDQVMCLVVARPHLSRRCPVIADGVRRGTDGKSSHQPAAAEAIDHGKLFCDADRRIVQGKRVAKDHDRRIGVAAREDGGDQIGRVAETVAVLVMLVDAEAVEAKIVGQLEFLDIPAQVLCHLLRVAQLVVWRRHPDAFVSLGKVVRQISIALHVKEDRFHVFPLSVRGRQQQHE